jgi:hypothetical protein
MGSTIRQAHGAESSTLKLRPKGEVEEQAHHRWERARERVISFVGASSLTWWKA